MRSGHNRAVDWWSLGALMYDMLTGAVSSNIPSAGGGGLFFFCLFFSHFVPFFPNMTLHFFGCFQRLYSLLLPFTVFSYFYKTEPQSTVFDMYL